MKGSIIILSFFIAGLILSRLGIITVENLHPNITFYILAALLLSIGFSIGHQPTILQDFKSLKRQYLALPFVTILGTWSGVLILSFFVKESIFELLALSSGFGFYSVSSVIISKSKGVELGVIAFLANIFRELITLVVTPILVRYFGKLSPIAAGGATTMDTTLPVILKYSGKEYFVLAIYSGFILDFLAPFLVSIFCSL